MTPQWVDVTDPREPLHGRRFRVESISRSPDPVAYVFVRREDGIVLRVPLRATNLSTLVQYAPRAKLSTSSIAEFLGLMKEYELCRPRQMDPPNKCGQRSSRLRGRKS
jgi:hypothetical protein